MSQTRRTHTKRRSKHTKRVTPSQEHYDIGDVLSHQLDNIHIEGFELAGKGVKELPDNLRRQLELHRVAADLARQRAELAKDVARWRLAAIARDLAPIAAGLARRGRPRLLATLVRLVEQPTPPVKIEAKAEAKAQTATNVTLKYQKPN